MEYKWKISGRVTPRRWERSSLIDRQQSSFGKDCRRLFRNQLRYTLKPRSTTLELLQDDLVSCNSNQSHFFQRKPSINSNEWPEDKSASTCVSYLTVASNTDSSAKVIKDRRQAFTSSWAIKKDPWVQWLFGFLIFLPDEKSNLVQQMLKNSIGICSMQ